MAYTDTDADLQTAGSITSTIGILPNIDSSCKQSVNPGHSGLGPWLKSEVSQTQTRSTAASGMRAKTV